jgi:putative tryptophan/tyrosine transport system substrate-binding protein
MQITPHQYLLNKYTRVYRWWMVLMFVQFAFSTAPIWSSEVLIVLSAEREPYRQTQVAVTKELARFGHTTQPILLDKLNSTYAIPSATSCVISIGTPAAVWLHQQPFIGKKVYCMVSDPASAGLNRPPPISGVTTDIPISAQLTLITDTLPEVRIIGTLYQQQDPKSVATLDELRKHLPPSWRIEAVAIDAYDSPAGAIDALLDKRLDLVWTAPDPIIYTNASVRNLLLTALRRRVPVFGFSASFVRAGALLGVGINPDQQGQQVAQHLQAILSGAPSGDTIIIPTYDICLNLVVAQKLSLNLPPAVIERAKQLFQPGR